MRELLNAYNSIPKKTLLLSDYELINESCNGIDYIKQLTARNSSILVTARSEDKDILIKVTEEHIKLLPKILASDIPIINTNDNKCIVLIDDDQLVHMSWKIEMKKKKHRTSLILFN